MTQKKIVFFLFNLGLGGAEQVVVRLSNYLDSQGFKIHILCVTNRNDFEGKLTNNVLVTSFGKEKVYQSFLPLIKFIRKQDFDSFVSNVWPLTFFSVIAGISSKKFLRKLILIEHSHLKEQSEKKSFLFKLFQQLTIGFFHNFSRKIICVSYGVQDDLISKGVKRIKTKVIHNPAYPINGDGEESLNTNSRKWIEEGNLKLISVGNLKSEKNYPNLIKAVEIIKKNSSLKPHLLILGEGPERDNLEAIIKNKNLEKEVNLMGLHSNPLNLVKKADLFILPSNFEGFGVAIVEALSVGITVVSTECLSGPSEIIKNNEFGYLCKVDDPIDLARQIKFAVKNKIDAEKLKRRSKDFSIEKIGPIYKELLDFPS